VLGWGFEVLCPRCKTSMDYVSEVERGDVVRVSRFYRCPACGFRALDERATIRRGDDGVVVEFSVSTNRKVLVVKSPRL